MAAYAKKYTANIEFTDIKEEDKYLVLKGCAESFQKFVAICKSEIVNFTIEETLEEDFLKILQGERK